MFRSISIILMIMISSVASWGGETKIDDDLSFIKIGPAGRRRGDAWNEKGHNKIAQIFISHDYDSIYSIQFQYVENGIRVMSNRHGNHNVGSNFDVVKLNCSEEYITWISGFSVYGNLYTITFGTNRGQYGPYGSLTATRGEFEFRVGDQFGGFHGYANPSGVHAIGVYLKPITTELGDVKFRSELGDDKIRRVCDELCY